MALILKDRVQQTGTSTGTASFTFSATVTGFQDFSVIGNGNTTYYAATDTTGNWEVGLGTFASGGSPTTGTLTRTAVFQSSNSNTGVTFSGTVTVFVTYPADRSIAQGRALINNMVYGI